MEDGNLDLRGRRSFGQPDERSMKSGDSSAPNQTAIHVCCLVVLEKKDFTVVQYISALFSNGRFVFPQIKSLIVKLSQGLRG